MYRSRTRRAATAALFVLGATAACDESPTQAPITVTVQHAIVTGRERDALDVYTQNLYLGGDTSPLFDPAVVGDLSKLIPAVNAFWTDVQNSDVPGRMARIADQIAEQGPELVGVQEALQFAVLNGQGQYVGGTVIDLLGALVAAIQAKGLPYDVVVVQSATSSALPLAVDPAAGVPTALLGFTDRVAILKRSDVDVVDVASGIYGAGIPITPNVQIRRAWARATAHHDGADYHFVNTHLETQSVRVIHDLQAAELMGILGALDGTTVLVGDLNSDAEGVDGDPSWTPTYGNLVAAGFSDLWGLAPHDRTDPGLTCCQADDLQNLTSELNQRIDFVLVRSTDRAIPEGEGMQRGHFRADVIGDRLTDMTPSGRWPSDHAGLVASMRLD